MSHPNDLNRGLKNRRAIHSDAWIAQSTTDTNELNANLQDPILHHTFTRPQLRVAVQGASDGVPVLMSHALGLDLSMWNELAARLATNHPVLRYDHRGQGGSALSEACYAMDDLVDDAARLILEWDRGPVVFIGLSMGGMVGQGLAILHPGMVRGLVLANTTSRYPATAQPGWAQRIATVHAQGMAGVVDAVVERYLHADHRARRPAEVQALRAQLLRSNAAGYAAACEAVRAVDWMDRLHQIKCPTLVIAGKHDAGAPPEMAEAIAERISGAVLEVFDDASHLSVAEQPQRFAQAVEKFLSSLP